MWIWLQDNVERIFGYDGSNWQAIVGMILGSPVSLIFYGWQLLCSGSNLTSLEGILCMIAIIIFIWDDVTEIAAFGDDVMVNKDKGLGELNIIHRDKSEHEKVFLGYNLIEKRAMGVKICKDVAQKMKSSHKGIENVGWMINKPDLTVKIQILIAYGFMETTNPIQLNIDSKEFLKSSKLIENMDWKMWKACIAEYDEKFSKWWD